MFNSLNYSSVWAKKDEFEMTRTIFLNFLLTCQGECLMHYPKFLYNRLSMGIQMNDIGLRKIFYLGVFEL